MAKQNNIGEQIIDAVQDAINSKDYSKLNQTVSQSLGTVVENLGNSLKNVGENLGNQQTTQTGTRKTFNQQWINQPYEEKRRQEIRRQEEQQRQRRELEQVQNRYKATTMEKTRGYLMTVGGGAGMAFFTMGTLITFITAIITGGEAVGGGFLLLFLLALCSLLFAAGITRVKLTNSFQNYVRIIGKRSFCEIKELSSASGKPDKYVLKQLRKMMNRGWFREGHLDEQETCIMVTNEVYQQYKTTQIQQKELQKQEKIRQERNDSKIKPSKEVQGVLEEGNAYLARIHASNEAIPGEEISRKISHMELIIEKIFQRAEENPKVIPDLKKLMEYYLPTTVKLLDAYEDMDRQPIQGENIASSKKEIEKTLDTLNIAFEKILDSVFKDMAWDVSTDISVLHTILAQEGLAGEAFKENK